MMRVKGTSIKATSSFIRRQFKDSGFDQWFEALSDGAKELFHPDAGIMTNSWYPMDLGFIEPHRVAVNLFYLGDTMGVWKMGRHAAEYGLRGVYKIFVRIGSPTFLIKKTSQVFNTFYEPGKAFVPDHDKGYGILRIVDFPEKTGLVEIRVAGWVERALEISGCDDVSVVIGKSLTKGDDHIEIICRWKEK
jgi:hypothetical protein